MRGSLDLPRAEPGVATDPGMALWTGDEIPNANEAGATLQQSLHGRIAREQREKAAAATACVIRASLSQRSARALC